MTQKDWDQSATPEKMLWLVNDSPASRTSANRKLRYIAIAFCRSVVHLLNYEDWHQPIAIAEQCADGLLQPDQLKEWHDKAHLTGYSIGNAPAPWTAELYALGAVGDVVHPDSYQAARNTQWLAQNALHPDDTSPGGEPIGTQEHTVQAAIIRDVVGSPFRTTTTDPAWLTQDVVALARQMHDTRDFRAISILADALEEAGCVNPDILAHCRESGPHVRGCWVVDLILQKK